jgi:hypothetical protein
MFGGQHQNVLGECKGVVRPSSIKSDMLLSFAVGYLVTALIAWRYEPSSDAPRWLAIVAALCGAISMMHDHECPQFDWNLDCTDATGHVCQIARAFHEGPRLAFSTLGPVRSIHWEAGIG